MGNFEIQVQADVFLAAQLAALQARKTCPPAPVSVGGATLVVHQIEFTTNSLRHDKPATFPVFFESGGKSFGLTATGFQTQVVQNLVLHIGPEDDVLTHPNAAPVSVQPLPLSITMDLDYFIGSDPQCYFRLTPESPDIPDELLSSLPPGVDHDMVNHEIENLISAALPVVTQPLNFAQLLNQDTEQLPGGTTVSKVENAGVSVSDDGTLLVFRAEVDAGSSLGDVVWGNFYSGSMTNQLQGADWGMFAEAGMVEGFITRLISVGIQNAPLPATIHVTDVHSVFSAPGGVPHVETTISADVDEPSPLGTGHIEAPLSLDFSVSQSGDLVINVTLPDLPTLGWDLLAPVRDILLALTGPWYGFIQAAILSPLAKARFPSQLDPSCVKVDDHHQVCTKSFAFPQFDGSVLRPRAALGQSDGMVITGDLPVPDLTPSQLSDISFQDFAWAIPQITCSSGDIAFAAQFASDPAGLALVRAQLFLEHTGNTPAYLCRADIINDPLGVFPSGGLSWDTDQMPVTLTLEVPNPGPAYAVRHYPIDVLVTTTLGQRLVRLPPAPALTDEEIIRLKALAIGAAANCELLTTPQFSMRWLVDPPAEREVVHLWQLGIENSLPGQEVRLFGAGGQPMASFRPQAGLTAKINAVVAPAGASELSLASSLAGQQSLATRISIAQKLYETAGRILLSAQAQRVFPTAAFAGQALVAVLDDTVTAYDMSSAAQPDTVGSWPVSGLRGTFDGPAGLLAFTGSQFYSLAAGQPPAVAGPAEPDPVLAAAPADDGVFVLTLGRLQIRSADLSTQQTLDSRGATALLRLGSRLLAGGPSGLDVYPVVPGPALGTPVSSLTDLSMLALEPAAGQDDGSVLATLTDGTARLLTLADDGTAQAVTQYPSRPWFAGGALAGDTLVLPDDDGWSLRISVPRAERTVGSDATDVYSSRLAFTDWTTIGENRAEGVLHGQPVILTGLLGTGSVTDRTFPLYDSDACSPRLPDADTVNIVALGRGESSGTFTITFGAPVQDPVLQLASFGSLFTFLPGTPVAKVSGDPALTVTSNTASGVVSTRDTTGTIRLYGLYTSIEFRAEPNFADGQAPDGIYLQIGALNVGEDDPASAPSTPS